MFDGKMVRGETGTPIRMIDLANNSLAEAEPEPLTLENLTTKSLTAWIPFMVGASDAAVREQLIPRTAGAARGVCQDG